MAPISRDILLLAIGAGIAIAFPWFVRRMDPRTRNRKPTNRRED